MSGTSHVPSLFSSTEVRRLLKQRGWVFAHQVPSETKATLRVVTVDGKRYCIAKDKTPKGKLCRVLALRLALRLRSGNLNLESLPHLAIGGSYILPTDPEAPDLWSYDSEEGNDAKLAFLDLRFFQGLGEDLGDGEYTGPLVRIPVRDAHGDVVTRDVYEFVRDKGRVIDRKKVRDTDGSIRQETVYHLYAKYAKAETKMNNGRDITVFLPPAIRLDFFFFLQLSVYLPPDWSENCPNVMGRQFYDAVMTMCVYHTGEMNTHNWFVHEDHREIIDRYFDPDDPDFKRADGTCDSKARNVAIERAREQVPIIDQKIKLLKNKGKRLTPNKCLDAVKKITEFYVQGIPEDRTAAPAARAMPPIIEITDSLEESSSSDSSSSEEEESSSLFDEEQVTMENQTAKKRIEELMLEKQAAQKTIQENQAAQKTIQQDLTAQNEAAQKTIQDLTVENQAAQKRIEALTAQNEAAQKTIQEKQAAQKTIQDLTVESQAAQKTIQDLMLEKQAAQKRIKALTTAQSEAADQAAASKKRKRTPRTKSQRVLDGDNTSEEEVGKLYSYEGCEYLWFAKKGKLVETNLPTETAYVLNAEGVPACP